MEGNNGNVRFRLDLVLQQLQVTRNLPRPGADIELHDGVSSRSNDFVEIGRRESKAMQILWEFSRIAVSIIQILRKGKGALEIGSKQ